MKERAQDRYMGWITAAVAVIASIILIIDIVAHKRGESIDGALSAATIAAAEAAGASVRPSGPEADPRTRLR